MKPIKGFVLAVGAMIVAPSMNAWSQGAPAASASNASEAVAPGAAAPATGKQANKALRHKVYAAIAKHKINTGSISVVAKDGAVTLYGTVKEYSQVAEVAKIAEGVPGVTSVTNKLAYRPPFGH